MHDASSYLQQCNEPRPGLQSENAAKSQFPISSSCSLNKPHVCECSKRKRRDECGQTNTSPSFYKNLQDNHAAPGHRVGNPRGEPWCKLWIHGDPRMLLQGHSRDVAAPGKRGLWELLLPSVTVYFPAANLNGSSQTNRKWSLKSLISPRKSFSL